MFLCHCVLEICSNFHFVVNARISFPTESLLNVSWFPGRGAKESCSQLLYLYSKETCPSGFRHGLFRRLVHGVTGEWMLTGAGKIHQDLGNRQCTAQAQALQSPILMIPVSRITSIWEKTSLILLISLKYCFGVFFGITLCVNNVYTACDRIQILNFDRE